MTGLDSAGWAAVHASVELLIGVSIGLVVRLCMATAEMAAGAIAIDDRAKQVSVRGEPVSLSPKEYELLKLLAEDPGRVFSDAELIALVLHTEGAGR